MLMSSPPMTRSTRWLALLAVAFRLAGRSGQRLRRRAGRRKQSARPSGRRQSAKGAPGAGRAALARLCAVAALLFTVIAAPGPASAQGERRVALIIGNSGYANVASLANPGNDVAAMSAALREAGFETVDVHRDLDKTGMLRALRSFEDKVEGAAIGVIFFAGHGIEINRENYLLPIDARLAIDRDVEDEAVSLDRLLRSLDKATRLRLVILDACRDNPFLRTMRRSDGRRSVDRGLGRFEPRRSDTLVAFAAKEGTTAADGADANSPFTKALIAHLPTPGLDIRIALGQVRDEVLKATNNRQEPFVYGSLGGGLVSLSGKGAASSQPSIDSAYRAAQQIGTEGAWQAFLGYHPSGFYADLARAALSKLQAGDGAVRPPPASAATPDPDIAARRDFEATRSRRSVAAWDQFLARHPTGVFGERGRQERDLLIALESRPPSNATQQAALSLPGDVASPSVGQTLPGQAGGEVELIIGKGGEGAVTAVAPSPDGQSALAIFAGGPPVIWNLRAGTVERAFRNEGRVLAGTFSPDGKALLLGGEDGALRLVDRASGEPIRRFTGHAGEVRSVAFSPDGRFIASAGGMADRSSPKSSLILWNAATGDRVRSIDGHSELVRAVAFSRDGQSLLSGGDDLTLKLWRVSNGQLTRTYRGHSSWITAASFSPDGRRILSASADSTLRLWDVDRDTAITVLRGHRGPVHAAAFVPDSDRVVSVGEDGAIVSWIAEAGQIVKSVDAAAEGFRTVHALPDGNRLLLGGRSRTLSLKERSIDDWLTRATYVDRFPQALAYRPDGAFVTSDPPDAWFSRVRALERLPIDEHVRTHRRQSLDVLPEARPQTASANPGAPAAGSLVSPPPAAVETPAGAKPCEAGRRRDATGRCVAPAKPQLVQPSRPPARPARAQREARPKPAARPARNCFSFNGTQHCE